MALGQSNHAIGALGGATRQVSYSLGRHFDLAYLVGVADLHACASLNWHDRRVTNFLRRGSLAVRRNPVGLQVEAAAFSTVSRSHSAPRVWCPCSNQEESDNVGDTPKPLHGRCPCTP